MVTIRSGSEVMAPHPKPGGGYILKVATVLVVMPELCIIEYVEDKMRHCLPRGALRIDVTRAPAVCA